jgi:zinc protease
VQKFHATYYRPDNATLVVAGDIDPKQLDEWVDKYFGAIPKPSTPIPRPDAKEPPHDAAKTLNETGPNVPLPAVAISWVAPPRTSEDRYPLQVAATILGDGESSRLYQSLVYRQQIAQEVGAEADLRENAGIFVIDAVAASGKSLDEVKKSIDAELRRITDKPVSEAELEKAKNLIVTSQLRRLETDEGKAFAIGYAATVLHDAALVNDAVKKFQAVTAADVQRVMDKYVKNGKSVTIDYASK